MKRGVKIFIVGAAICLIVPSIVVPIYFYGFRNIQLATVESIIIDSVADTDNIGPGPERFFNCIVNITISSQQICDTLHKVTIETDENSLKVTIQIHMKINNPCMLPAFYSGMISLSVILTQYADWIITCNNYEFQLDISDYLLI